VKKASESIEDMTIVLSVHDVIPAYEDDIIKTYDLLADSGITNFTLLITPFYQMKKANTFLKESIFSEYLLSLSLEMSLHGYSHFTKSGSMHEYSEITSERALTRLKDGMALFKKGFGIKPTGFVPPLWDSPPRVLKSAKQIGLNYCVIRQTIYRLDDMKAFTTADPIISQGLRSFDIEPAMLEIELGGALQIAIHPKDHKMNNMFDFLCELRDQSGYRFIGYAEYINEKK